MNVAACEIAGVKESLFPQTRQRPWTSKDSLVFLGVVFTASLLFIPTLGLTGIIDPSEGYYAEAAREMVELGNYVVPTLNYEPWYEKPILPYWLIAASYQFFGISEFSARLPSALSGILLVGYMFLLTRSFVPRRIALLASVVLICSPLFAIVGHLCLTDMPFALFVTMTLGGFFSALNGGPSVFLRLAWVSLGLALLCKGPLAIVLVAIVLGAYLIWISRCPSNWYMSVKRLNVLQGCLIVALIALPWYVLVSVATHGDFLQEFFVRQNLGRATGIVNHRNPIWYYLPYYFIGFAPWSILLLEMGPIIVARLGKKKPTTSRFRLAGYCFLWLVLFLLFFSLVPTKLGTYILPLAPALAIVVACGLDLVFKLRAVSTFRVFSVFILITGLGAIFFLPVILRNAVNLVVPIMSLASLMYVILFTSSVLLWQRHMRAFAFGLVLCMVVGLATLVPIGMTAYYYSHQQGFRELLRKVEKAKARVAIIGPTAPSAAFYLQKQCPNIKSQEQFLAYISDKSVPNLLLVSDSSKAVLGWIGLAPEKIASSGRWSLYGIDKQKDK